MNISISSDEADGDDDCRGDGQLQHLSTTFDDDLQQLMQEKVLADEEYSFRFKVIPW